jgi:hypothetical protein
VSKDVDADADLLADLRSVIDRTDPVPPEVTEFAQAALGWRRLDADLAELLADSVLDTEATALTRSEGGGRWLTFRAAELAIDVEVQAADAGFVVLGQLAPPPPAATVELQAEDGSVVASVEADALGRFRLTVPNGGRVRLRILQDDPPAPAVETSWLSL